MSQNENYSNRPQQFLDNKASISISAFYKEITWAYVGMALGILLLWLFEQYSAEPGQEYISLIRILVQLPSHCIAIFFILTNRSEWSIKTGYIIVIWGNIIANIASYNFSPASILPHFILYSIGHITLSACIFAIAPKTVAINGSIFLLSLVGLWYKSLGVADPDTSLVVALTFIFSVISLSFAGHVFLNINKKMHRLMQDQQEQLKELRATQDILNFALKETKQTVVFKDEKSIFQYPEQNTFSKFIDNLDATAILPTDLLTELTTNGFQASSVRDLTGENAVNMRVLNDMHGQSYVLTMTLTPGGFQTLLLTDVTKIVRTGGLLNAALNGNKIGVSCYDEKGKLHINRGAKLKNISDVQVSSFSQISNLAGRTARSETKKLGVLLGETYYDFTFLQYGELNLVTYVDVTHREQVEAELRLSHKMSVIGELTSGVAHDYNNILAIILANIEAIKLIDKNGAFSNEVDEAIKAVEHAADISKRLLSLAGQNKLNEQVILSTLCIETVKSLIASATQKHIEIIYDLVEEAHIYVDVKEFQTAILNLVVNASSSIGSKKGTIGIATKIRDGSLILTVTDDGPGIPLEIRDRVFEPFVSTHAREYSTGLGLSMVRSFVTQAGGRVYLPDVSKGAVIAISLPIVEVVKN